MMETHGNELWKSDGTAEGTSMVKDIWPGGGSGHSNTGARIVLELLLSDYGWNTGRIVEE